MSTLSIWQWVMLLMGAGLASAAVTALWGPRVSDAISARREARANGARARDVEPFPPAPLGMTEPTRLSVGIVLLVWGYHMVVWALPAAWGVDFVVPVRLWPLVLGGGIVWAGGSLLMDVRDRSRPGGGGGSGGGSHGDAGPDRDPN